MIKNLLAALNLQAFVYDCIMLSGLISDNTVGPEKSKTTLKS